MRDVTWDAADLVRRTSVSRRRVLGATGVSLATCRFQMRRADRTRGGDAVASHPYVMRRTGGPKQRPTGPPIVVAPRRATSCRAMPPRPGRV
jgi:hypothetical protein